MLASWVKIVCVDINFFFSSRRRHTRCSRDWSSDVCSSDLVFLMADSSILDGNRWPHWGQFCGLSTPARVDLRGGSPERLEPACGCNSSARSINSYDTAGLILPWFILYRAFGSKSR